MAGSGPEQRSSRLHKESPRYLKEARTLGLRIRALREMQGWTLEEAAARSDLDLKHLQKIEAGQLNVTLVTLVRLAVGLQQPMSALFAGPMAKSFDRRRKRSAKTR